MPARDPAAAQLAGGDLNPDSVARRDADEVPPHLAGEVAEYGAPILHLGGEHPIPHGLDVIATGPGAGSDEIPPRDPLRAPTDRPAPAHWAPMHDYPHTDRARDDMHK